MTIHRTPFGWHLVSSRGVILGTYSELIDAVEELIAKWRPHHQLERTSNAITD